MGLGPVRAHLSLPCHRFTLGSRVLSFPTFFIFRFALLLLISCVFGFDLWDCMGLLSETILSWLLLRFYFWGWVGGVGEGLL